jgi:hypothetical protein
MAAAGAQSAVKAAVESHSAIRIIIPLLNWAAATLRYHLQRPGFDQSANDSMNALLALTNG